MSISLSNKKLDYIALSFVRAADDVIQLSPICSTRATPKFTSSPKSKCPKRLENLDAIIAASDAVLVARGDLGVEMDLTSVPLIQKEIVHAAHDAAKPCIVATQMLQSMVDNPTPTRAEVSDVANAILDGADAVMLSGETAVGKYPVGRGAWSSPKSPSTPKHTSSKRASSPPRPNSSR